MKGFFYVCTLIKFKIIITMGRGDKKTAKGKRFKGSFGKSRPQKVAVKKAEVKAS
ncbi:MAG: 30S ribosomal protein THX [Chitinophagaceae bacterium]